METSKENNNSSANLSDIFLENMIDMGVIASCLLSPLTKITNFEHRSQFKILRDLHSNQIKDLLIKKSIPVNLYDNLLTIRDTNKMFEFGGELLKMITYRHYNIDLASLLDKN